MFKDLLVFPGPPIGPYNAHSVGHGRGPQWPPLNKRHPAVIEYVFSLVENTKHLNTLLRESFFLRRRLRIKLPAAEPLSSCLYFTLSRREERALFHYRDIPNMLSGGDLDGDQYFVLWDPLIVAPLYAKWSRGEATRPSKTHEPSCGVSLECQKLNPRMNSVVYLNSPSAEHISHPQDDGTNLSFPLGQPAPEGPCNAASRTPDESAAGQLVTHSKSEFTVSLGNLIAYVLRVYRCCQLGPISKAHIRCAHAPSAYHSHFPKKAKAHDADCLQLAELAIAAVDTPKTGHFVRLNHRLKCPLIPHFLANYKDAFCSGRVTEYLRKVFVSRSILGRLFDNVEGLIPIPHTSACADCRGNKAKPKQLRKRVCATCPYTFAL